MPAYRRQILKGTYGFPSFPNTTPLGYFFGTAPGVVGGVTGASFVGALALCAGSAILSSSIQTANQKPNNE
jgi:hypothetical protein